MSTAEEVRDSIERTIFQVMLLALGLPGGVGWNTLGLGNREWTLVSFVAAGVVFLIVSLFYIIALGKIKIRTKDADKVTKSHVSGQVYARLFIDIILLSFSFGGGIVASYLGAGGLWTWFMGAFGGVTFLWLVVKGKVSRIRVLAEESTAKTKKPKSDKE